jgi:CubicO group peptidase (beta-lactamase class C family)
MTRGLVALIGLALLSAAPSRAEPLPVLGGATVAGYAVAAVGRDGRLRTEAAGAAELTPQGAVVRPLTADTPMRVASISKLALALAIHRLADRGVLALDDDVSQHLGFTLRNPAHPHTAVTIGQVLRHESSLSDAGGYMAELGTSLAAMLGPDHWSDAAPGTRFDYANIGSAVLATIVEQRTGQRFDRAMDELVFGPLGIRACYNWSGCPDGHAASGAVLYRKSTDYGVTWVPEGPWIAQVDAVRPAGGCPVRTAPGAGCDLESYQPGTHGGLFAPQGGLRIAIGELARLGHALATNRGGFLKPATHRALFAGRPLAPAGTSEETDAALMRLWSDGGLHCFGGDGAPGADQPHAPAAMAGCGHLGSAYGLKSALVIDHRRRTAMAWALTGTAAAPPPGAVSRFSAPEEALALRARALLP